jgi:hypothetical protein
MSASAENVLSPRLRERQAAGGSASYPTAWGVLEDDGEADARQHPLDDRGREVIPDDARAREAERHLDDAGQHHRQQEGLPGAQRRDGGEDDDRQAGGGPADAQGGPAGRPHHDAADDAGNDAREERGARRERDAQAEWGRHEEHDNGGGQIRPEAVGKRDVSHAQCSLSLERAALTVATPAPTGPLQNVGRTLRHFR